MPRIARNIAPSFAATPTFEDLISEEQKPIDTAPTLSELAAVLDSEAQAKRNEPVWVDADGNPHYA